MLSLPLFALVASSPARLTVNVGPKDCSATAGCSAAFKAAVEKCKDGDPAAGCDVVLEPGRYRVECPKYEGIYAYINTPGAVDLSNSSGVTFGAADLASPAFLGCVCFF